MLSNKEIANRLREIIQGEGPHPYAQLELLADTLDPPRPEPGTMVWWRACGGETWALGMCYGRQGCESVGVADLYQTRYRFSDIEYKPARILADDEVAVQVPPTQTWGHRTTDVEIVLRYWDVQNEDHSERVQLITRAEAQRREREAGR